MIELDFVNHLKTDSGLISLLSITAGDPKIYPVVAEESVRKTTPYIVYDAFPVGKGFVDLLDEIRIDFSVVSESYEECSSILARLKNILEINDEFRTGIWPLTVSSSFYWIYDIRRTGGNVIKEQDTRNFVKMESYSILYRQK